MRCGPSVENGMAWIAIAKGVAHANRYLGEIFGGMADNYHKAEFPEAPSGLPGSQLRSLQAPCREADH
jgi:hypothetical protein